jgi:hypothetical protein
MTDVTSVTSAGGIWLAKGAGAAAGSALSLVYMLPASRREATARFAAGLIAGLVFGGTVGVTIAGRLGVAAHLGEVETMLMGSAAASAAAWWALGAAARIFARTGEAKETRDGGKHG